MAAACATENVRDIGVLFMILHQCSAGVIISARQRVDTTVGAMWLITIDASCMCAGNMSTLEVFGASANDYTHLEGHVLVSH